jgi:hypothetical protein
MDTSRCPICGAENACAMARDPGAGDCWCFNTPITQQARSAIPEDAMGLVCICARCATSETPGAPDPSAEG